jgi:hypothetical protein
MKSAANPPLFPVLNYTRVLIMQSFIDAALSGIFEYGIQA